jgi:hypothetical protein
MGRIFPFLSNIVVTVAIGSVLALFSRPTALGSRAEAGAGQCFHSAARALIYGKAYAQDSGVFRYQDRNGRTVYTNLEGSASHGKALTHVELPPLSSVDFEHAKPDELRALDAHVRESHGALQSGKLCEAIRAATRTAQRSRLWEDHGRKISVAGGLLVFAALLGFLGAGRKLGSLWPLPPIAGCLFLGYATWRDVQAAREALTAGLRACSEELPEGEPDDKVAVQGRLGKALDLQNIINHSYERQTAEIDAIMRER